MIKNSQLGFGTAALGRPQYINLRQKDNVINNLELFRQHSFSVLEKAYKLGIRYFDTAPGYGLAEKLLIDWLQTKNNKSIKIASKWGYTYTANFKANATIHEVKEHSLKKLNEQWATSKALLPNLKVYQIHSATLETGVLENKAILDRLAFLKSEFQLKIGLSTTGADQVEVIKKALDTTVEGKQVFDAFQVTYNMLDQSLDNYAGELEQHNKKLIIKEALANGRLFRNKNYPQYFKLYYLLEALAQKYKVGVDAIALNYCAQTHPKSTVLSGASSAKQLEENLKMYSFKLSKSELLKLREFRVDPKAYWQERKNLSWN